MQEQEVLEKLFDSKIIRILKALFREDKEFYLQEIAAQSRVSMATASRILHRLENLGIVSARKVSRIRLYRAEATPAAKFLERLFKEDLQILRLFTEKASQIRGVQSIILHGKESRDKANVLLIGEDIDPGEVKGICAEIAEKHHFSISPLSLTPEQYMQMSQMGLYSGTKRLLYEKP